MKPVYVFLILGIFISFLLYPAEVSAERRDPLKKLFDKKEIVKAYVADIKNSSGDDKLDVKALKSSIENALATRKSQRFEIVNKKSGADIIVLIEVLEYMWTDTDPIDTVVGVAGMAYDLLRKEDYAYIKVFVSVSDTKTGALLWKDKFKATLTEPDMTEEESYGMMYKRLAKVFMQQLLKK